MMQNDLISVREGLRSPRNFVVQLLRKPGTYARAFLRRPRQALFGFPESAARPVENRTTPEPSVESLAVSASPQAPAWPDLGLWPWQSPPQMIPAKMPNGKPWPRISIVTPTYQQGEFIERTIR